MHILLSCLLLVPVFIQPQPPIEKPATALLLDDDGIPLPAGAIRRFGSTRYSNVTQLSADGKFLFTHNEMLNVKTGLSTGIKLKPAVTRYQFVPSPDGKTVYYYGVDEALLGDGKGKRRDACLCDAKNGDLLYWLSDRAKTLFPRWMDFDCKAIFSPDGRLLVTNESEDGNPGQIRMWDVQQGVELWSHSISESTPASERLKLIGMTRSGHVVALTTKKLKYQAIFMDRQLGRIVARFDLPNDTDGVTLGPMHTLLSWNGQDGTIHQ
jgi:hypothetical protein